MSENDPLRSVLQEWKAPEPSAALDESVRAGFRALRPQSAWAQFWSARITLPLPAVLAAMAFSVVAGAAWMIALRSSSPTPAPRRGVVTRFEATGFVPVPDGSALVKEVTQQEVAPKEVKQ
jgi:hypothetical protein